MDKQINNKTFDTHQFKNLAEALDWDGTEQELMEGLEKLADERQRTHKSGGDCRDPG